MNRRKFIGASALALAGTARLAADAKAAEKPREPDLVIKNHRGCLAFSPDSKVLAVANGPIGDKEGICLLDPATGKRLDDFERATDVKTEVGYRWPQVLAFSNDGKWFAAGGEGYVGLWSTATGRRLPDIQMPDGSRSGTVTAFGFTMESKYVFAGPGFWPIAPRGELQRLDGLDRYGSVAFSSNGKLFATRFQGLVTLWKYPERRKVKVIGEKQRSAGPLLFAADGIHILSMVLGDERQPTLFWNIQTGRPREIHFEHAPEFFFDLTSDGSRFVAAVKGAVAVLSAETGELKQMLLSETGFREDDISDLKIAPNRKIIAVSRLSGVQIWKDNNGF